MLNLSSMHSWSLSAVVLDFAEVQVIFVVHSIDSNQEFVGLFLDSFDQACEEVLFV